MAKEKLNAVKVPNLRFPGFEGEWETITIDDVSVSLDYGMNAAAKKFDGENKYIRITDIDDTSASYKSNEPVSPDGRLENRFLVSNNDMLLARTGASTGKAYLYDPADGKMYFAGFLIRARIKGDYNARFVFYQTQTSKYRIWVKVMSMRSGQPGINSQEYSSFNFFIPPSKREQDRIADLIAKLDTRIATQNKIIEELNVLKVTISKRIFLGRYRFEDGDVEYPDWNNLKLGDICSIIGGGTPDTRNAEYWNGSIKWFTPTEIKSNFVSRSQRTISKLGLENSSAKLLPKGTILLTTRATIGEVSISAVACATNQGFQSLIVNENCDNIFLFNWIKVNKHEFEKRANGSTFPEIGKSQIEKIEINIPCMEEQRKIADFLSSIDSKIEIENRLLQKLEDQKKFFLQQMFV